jgi:hypothetical protein
MDDRSTISRFSNSASSGLRTPSGYLNSIRGADRTTTRATEPTCRASR